MDVSAPMIARAKARGAGRPDLSSTLSFTLADASSQAFGETFDAVISRFGVMFFGDPAAAFAHLRGAMAPRGRLAFACWRPTAENEWVRVPYDAAIPFLTPPPPAGPEDPGPFSFGDRRRVERVLREAGFAGIDIAPFDAPVLLSGSSLDEAVAFATSRGPLARLLRQAPAEAAPRVEAAIRARFVERFGDGGPFRLGGAVWIVSATNPA